MQPRHNQTQQEQRQELERPEGYLSVLVTARRQTVDNLSILIVYMQLNHMGVLHIVLFLCPIIYSS